MDQPILATDVSRVIVDLFLLYAAARVGGAVFARLGQPAVVGELIAGVAIGPHALGWVSVGEVHEAFAEVGVVVLLFLVGLETPFAALRQVGTLATLVAVGGVALPFAAGSLLLWLGGHPTTEALFGGTALVATSVGITARVLADLGVLGAVESRVILAAAIVDDVLALLAMAAVTGVAAGELSGLGLAIVAAEALAFLAVLALVGTRLVRRYQAALEHWFPTREPLGVAFIALLGLSALATVIGLAAIIGAFLAGMVLAEARERYGLERQVASAAELVVPFFFVVTGARVDFASLLRGEALGLLAAFSLLAILTKLVGCGLPALRLGPRAALIVGVGMVPRGEIGFVVASLGLATGALGMELYGVIVAMAILTTLVTPPLLARLVAGRDSSATTA